MPAPKDAVAAAPAPGQAWAPNHGCDAGCCDACGGGCYAGAEVVYMWPNSDQHKAFLITNSATGANELRNFDVSAEFTPRLWLGWKNCDGLGARLRYWRFATELTESATNPEEEEEGPFGVGILQVSSQRLSHAIDEADFEFFADVDFSAPGNTIVARTDLRLWTVDLEITKDMEICGSELTVGAGIRYANTRSTLEVGQFNPAGTLVDSLRVKHQFDGFGPTFSLEARVPVAGMTAVLGLRTSIILTLANKDVDAAGTDFSGNPVSYTNSTDDGLFITEIFTGVEKCCETCYGKISFRAGYEAQYWSNVGLATRMDDNFSNGSSMWLDGFSIGVMIVK